MARQTILAAAFMAALSLPAPAAAQTDAAPFAAAVERAETLGRVNALIIARDGELRVERRLDGPGLDDPVNVKSVAKTIVAALVGIAIDKGVIEGPRQPVAELLGPLLPDDADPKLREVTVGNLLSMQAGLERTSGPNYGAWVESANWVRHALTRPFVDEPGGRMLYSTGNSHLLSAILTEASGESTLSLAREWLGEPLGITIPAWDRDPQGIYLGGNNMALSPRALLRFGEMVRNGGTWEGRRILSEAWIRDSWTARARSPFTGDSYGYGWFLTRMRGHDVRYAWGYGGQMLYLVPDLGLTIVMTSDTDAPSGRNGYARELHALVADRIIPAAEAMDD